MSGSWDIARVQRVYPDHAGLLAVERRSKIWTRVSEYVDHFVRLPDHDVIRRDHVLAVALNESDLKRWSLADTPREYSCGMMQINLRTGPIAFDPFDPAEAVPWAQRALIRWAHTHGGLDNALVRYSGGWAAYPTRVRSKITLANSFLARSRDLMWTKGLGFAPSRHSYIRSSGPMRQMPVRQHVRAVFDHLRSHGWDVGAVRPASRPPGPRGGDLHHDGRAIDVMIPRDQRDSLSVDHLAHRFIKHADVLGVQGVIWRGFMALTRRDIGVTVEINGGHYDHIHVEFVPEFGSPELRVLRANER